MPPPTSSGSKKKSNKSKHSGSDTESESATEEQTLSPQTVKYITTDQLETILLDAKKSTEACIKEAIKHELSSLKNEIVRLQSELETANNTANNAIKLAEQLKKDLTLLKEENAELKANLKNQKNEHEKIVELVEDNKNRQVRKTLVFKGIPEKRFDTEDGKLNPDGTPKTRPENWSETSNILATAMSEILGTTFEEAHDMVERCHRAAPNPRYKGTAPRPIFASFIDWRDSETTKDSARKINIENKNSTIYVENKYGPRTTVRRNMALKERRRLIDSKLIFNGYVSFPARLMVKDSKAVGAKYKLWKDFSKEPVNFDR